LHVKIPAMTKILATTLLLIGVSTAAMASTVPEIDGGSAMSALALLSGGLLLLRVRRDK
jgi:hypothetical protein